MNYWKMGIVLVLYIIKENFCTRRGEKSRSIAIIWGLGLMLFKEDIIQIVVLLYHSDFPVYDHFLFLLLSVNVCCYKRTIGQRKWAHKQVRHRATLRKETVRWISLMIMMSEGSFWKNGVTVILSAIPMIGRETGLGRRTTSEFYFER